MFNVLCTSAGCHKDFPSVLSQSDILLAILLTLGLTQGDSVLQGNFFSSSGWVCDEQFVLTRAWLRQEEARHNETADKNTATPYIQLCAGWKIEQTLQINFVEFFYRWTSQSTFMFVLLKSAHNSKIVLHCLTCIRFSASRMKYWKS